jgi:hypothetical protein
MDDVLGPTQGLECFRTKQAVRIGDDADEDESPQFSVLGFRLALIS